MKRYQVVGTLTVSCWTFVEADSAEEALEIAKTREVGGLCHMAITPEEDECFHFESDGEPNDLRVED